MKIKIPQLKEIINFLEELKITSEYSVPVIKNIVAFLTASVVTGSKGKTTDIERITLIDQTTISKFFSYGKWE